MCDTERLRKEAGQLLTDADKANRQGKSELAERLQARAAQRMQDAAVLEAAEIRHRRCIDPSRQEIKTRHADLRLYDALRRLRTLRGYLPV
jgi:hypothetical protein